MDHAHYVGALSSGMSGGLERPWPVPARPRAEQIDQAADHIVSAAG